MKKKKRVVKKDIKNLRFHLFEGNKIVTYVNLVEAINAAMKQRAVQK